MQQFLALITVLSDGGGGSPPLGMWGPTDPRPTNPISGPVFPGSSPPPGGGGGGPPLGMWGPNDPRPTNPISGPVFPPAGGLHPEHPIVIVPDPPPDAGEPPTGPIGAVEWHTVWTEETGWAVIGVPAGAHVTPSRGKRGA